MFDTTKYVYSIEDTSDSCYKDITNALSTRGWVKYSGNNNNSRKSNLLAKKR